MEERNDSIDVLQSNNRIALALFIGVSLLYISISRGIFLYGDDVLMYQVTEGIVERASVAVTAPNDDGSFPLPVIGDDGRSYAKYGIGQSLVAIPAYVASDLLLEPLLPLREIRDPSGNLRGGALIYGTALTNAVIGGATVALTFLLAVACGYSHRTSLVIAGLLAFGTLLAHYAATFMSEPLTALALLATVYGLLRAHQAGLAASTVNESIRSGMLGRQYGWLLFSGFAAGLALATRASAAVALVAPGLWLLWLASRWMRRFWRAGLMAGVTWGLPVALSLGGIILYNWTRFGSITETGYGGEAYAYTTPLLNGLYGLLLSPGRGIVWYDPPLLVALAGAGWFLRRRTALAWTILGILAGTLLLYSHYYAWYGGGAWGPRFLVPLLPLLILPAGEIIERAWKGWRVGIAAVLIVAVAGVFVTALGILVPYDRYVAEYNASPDQFEASIWVPEASPIVVHAARLDDPIGSPDIAAERYGSMRLGALSLLSGVLGIGVLSYAIVQALRQDRQILVEADDEIVIPGSVTSH